MEDLPNMTQNWNDVIIFMESYSFYEAIEKKIMVNLLIMKYSISHILNYNIDVSDEIKYLEKDPNVLRISIISVEKILSCIFSD